MEKQIISAMEEGARLGEELKELAPEIAKASRIIIDCLNSGGKVMICGNGGSAADSQHIAAELVGRFKRERRAMAAIALSTDSSILTSLANDYSFDRVFSRQVEALGSAGDLLILISTSGNSANLIEAARAAKVGEIGTMALLGRDGGKSCRRGGFLHHCSLIRYRPYSGRTYAYLSYYLRPGGGRDGQDKLELSAFGATF